MAGCTVSKTIKTSVARAQELHLFQLGDLVKVMGGYYCLRKVWLHQNSKHDFAM